VAAAPAGDAAVGLRVAYVCDPGGVLWHFQQRPKGE